MRGQILEVTRRHALEKRGGARAREDPLDHVAYVEDGAVLTGEGVGLADGEAGVLHGHVEAAEGDHFAAVG